jgi:hypothetical protein
MAERLCLCMVSAPERYLRNYATVNIQHTEVGKCLLSFGAESFVFQVAIQKVED